MFYYFTIFAGGSYFITVHFFICYNSCCYWGSFYIGFGFFFVVAINGMRHVLRTIAMSISVPPEHRRFTFFQAFAARLGGESMSFLTFAGPLLGEATKVAMLRKRDPLLDAAIDALDLKLIE